MRRAAVESFYRSGGVQTGHFEAGEGVFPASVLSAEATARRKRTHEVPKLVVLDQLGESEVSELIFCHSGAPLPRSDRVESFERTLELVVQRPSVAKALNHFDRLDRCLFVYEARLLLVPLNDEVHIPAGSFTFPLAVFPRTTATLTK